MITLAKRGDLHARRRALSIIREKKVVHELFDEAEEKFQQVIHIRMHGDGLSEFYLEQIKECKTWTEFPKYWEGEIRLAKK